MPERPVLLGTLILGVAGLLVAADEATPAVRWESNGEVAGEITWRPGPETPAGSCDGKEAPPVAQFACWVTGERLGWMTLHRSWRDRRGQAILPGDYVLRYGLQPFSKNHAGTTSHRDFLVLVRRGDDTASEIMTEETLWVLSRRASGTSHPAIMEIRDPEVSPARGEGEWLIVTTIDSRQVLLVVEAPDIEAGPF